MDFFGIYLLALITGTGGGVLRSVMLGDTPPGIFVDPAYLIIASIAATSSALFPELWSRIRRIVSVVDAFGLGVFACIGTQIALKHGLSWWAAALMGVISATFGGVIRDMWRAEVPLIFRQEIYATAAFAGALLLQTFQSLLGFSPMLSVTLSIIITAGLRLLAIRYALHKSS